MPKIRKAVITAAGKGTRQYPATNSVQKELIPLVDIDGYTKPTLQIILEDALACGIEEFCVIANPTNAEPIRSHFRGFNAEETEQFKGKDWAYPLSQKLEDIRSRLTIVIQHTQEGYGHAVYQAKDFAGNEPFVMLIGDHINISTGKQRCLSQIINAFDKYESPISSVARIHESQVKRYGTIAGETISGTQPAQYYLKTMAEKPTIEFARANLRTPGLPDDEYLCMYGLHAYTPDIFDCLTYLVDNNIRQNGEIQFAAAQKMLAEKRQYVLAELDGKEYDMGIPEGLLTTQLALALNSPYRDQVLDFVKTKAG